MNTELKSHRCHIYLLSHVCFPLVLVLLTVACSRPNYHYNVYGANEFVIDSHKIRQGKLSILEMEGVCLEPVPLCAMQEYEDVIDEGDILRIALYHPKRIDLMEAVRTINDQIGFRVQEGVVALPDAPSVFVAGLTLEQARLHLRNALQEQIQDVDVFITYQERLRRKVELTGAVAVPLIPVDGRIRLYEVLARAQVPNQSNLFMSYVVRDGSPLAIDLHRLMNKGDLTQNIVMRGGDKIFIANIADTNVMVMGEVLSPRPVHVPYGYISLREALVTAGGIPYTGNRDCIQVIRGNLRCPKIYLLSWDHIVHLPNDSLLCMPGDTIYVTEKPITQWNRFIDQLLPSWSGLERFYTLYKISQES